ncbi:Nucleoside ABC transporter, permease protein 1 [Tritonibacter mobilis]|mgnify:FL=1|jgi:peptide/nickel transport system permease protein|uniref:ABC transporter permease n=1 Tax=Tritonibacter mobilis F1926 TaxID=1265309 RepID=A0A1B1A0N9_9RHOB|nr:MULTISPECIES: ABC transporter permease [Tritonibacter]EEW60258.1 binding-protein-dependent transport systems inner membrane component [Ruegeria sp. TrichCH4B]MBW3242932.1 ABC transporter permease [Epibacterium sp. DP7N7-1]MCZ4267809.1 ABC transporter permease [Rhodobacteraceae bacterium G21628-S1]NKX36822.1 ABC transporter permease [Rhodobacteraceae bacterium R_SAG4]PXW81980.1 peptide/nickel transport system permease protein [Ruegeria sp. P4]
MNPVLKLLAQRIALSLFLLLMISALIFAGTMILPGDVAQSILGQSATPEALANLRADLGLNDPPLTRYFEWLFGALQGDLGTALTSGQDITSAIGSRLSNTLFLAFWAAIIAVPLAIFLGLLAVRYKDRWPDKLISGVTLASISIPEFLIGYVLMYLIAVKLRWFPSVAMINDSMSLWQKLNSIALPVAVLTLVVLAHMMRMTRAAILNVMQSAYIETAELKGLSTFKVIWRHAFPNSVAPIVNVVMLNLAYLVVGVVVIEVVFVYPGMGQYLVDHVSKRDVPVVQACGLIFAAVYIGLNMVADIVSILSNPRLRHPK